MSTPTEPPDPRLRRIAAALQAVPPARLIGEPWAAPAPKAARRRQAPRRRAGLLSLIGVLSGAGGVVASIASTSPSPSVSAATRDAFGVFNEKRVRPSRAAAAEAAGVFRSAGPLDPASIRVAQGNARFEIIVAANSNSVCLMGREPGLTGGRLIAAGGGCGSATPNATTPGLMCGTIEAPPRGAGMFLLDCLVPDGVSNVRIATPSGPIAPKIITNTVGVIVQRPTSVSWITPDGTSRQEHIIQ